MYNDRISSWYISVLLVVTILALPGCAKNQVVNENSGSAVVNSHKIVVDSLGRQVQLPEKVNKIGCLYAMSGQIVVMLGKGSNIVAVVDGLKRDVLLTKLAPNIKNAAVPFAGGVINIEELLKIKPDVVFISTDVAQNSVEVSKLEGSHIPYVVVDCKTIAEQQQVIDTLGVVVGNSEKSRKYNDYYQNIISRVQKQIASIPDKDRVRIYHSILEANRTDTPKTLSADWIKYAGAINVSINEPARLNDGGNKFFANVEQILLWAPDVIIVNESGVAEQILNDPQWAALKPVKQGKVYQMPVGISRWGHPGSIETPLAILWTAKTLYPERFTDVNLAEEIKQFYRDFFDLELTDEEVTMILKGKGKLKKGVSQSDSNS